MAMAIYTNKLDMLFSIKQNRLGVLALLRLLCLKSTLKEKQKWNNNGKRKRKENRKNIP